MADETLTKAQALADIHYQWFRDPIHTLYDQTAATNATVTSIDTRLTTAEADIDTLQAGGYFDSHFAGIYTDTLQTAQSIPNGASYTLFTKWTGDMAVSNGAIPDYTASTVTVAAAGAGTYHVIACVAGGFATSINFTWAIHVNGVAQTPTTTNQGYGPTNYWYGVNLDLILALANNAVVDLRVKHNSGSAQNVTAQHASLILIKINDTGP